MDPAVEEAAGAYQDVGRPAGPAQHLISQPAAVPLCGGIVWDNDHEVVVAIWPTLTAGQGAEQVDALRLIRLDEAPDNFGEHWILPDGGRIHGQLPHLPSFGVVYQVFQWTWRPFYSVPSAYSTSRQSAFTSSLSSIDWQCASRTPEQVGESVLDAVR